MKKFIPLICFIILIGLTSAVTTYVNTKGTATVNQVQGMHIFIQSKPATEFDYLGTVSSASMVKSLKEDDIVPHMIKRAKEAYPTADALVFVSGTNLCKMDALSLNNLVSN